MRLAFLSIFVFLVMSIVFVCNAASLQSVDLVVDGSADPPGDRLDFVIQFDKNDTSISLKVRGFRVSGQLNEQVQSLGQDQQTNWLATVVVQPDQGSDLVRARLVVPYAKLKLPEGEHQVAYEVVGLVRDEVIFVRPTKLTRVVVTANVRRQMSVSETRYQRSLESRVQQVRVAGERQRGKAAEPEQKQVAVETPITTLSTETKNASVEIPGEFLRIEPSDSEPSQFGKHSGLDQQAWRPLSELEAEGKRRVWFATNRSAEEDGDGKSQFLASFSDQVRYGSCVVNIPVQNHRKGKLELPTWWSERDPKLHFAMDRLETFDKSVFQQRFGDGDALLFVHGFYTTFEDAIYRAAQLQHDMDFRGQSVAFSWPSAGSITQYNRDQESADASVDALAEVIATLAASLKPAGDKEPKIHVIAHSLGNRLLLQTMYKINQSRSDYFSESPFGQVVLAAPDVGAIMFNNLSPHVVHMSDQVTYYYCESDTALITSREINKYEPVGLMPYFDDGLNTINANGVDTSFIGHGYYASSREVLSDVEIMLRRGASPSERMPPLAAETKVFGHRCWSFLVPKSNGNQ